MTSIDDILNDAATLPDSWALVALDRALREGLATMKELLNASDPDLPRVRELIALADPRAVSTADSIARCAWYAAGLRTPRVAAVLPTPFGPVHTICAIGYHRFAITWSVDARQSAFIGSFGWRVVTLDRTRVIRRDTGDLARFLRTEHLSHLLGDLALLQPSERIAS